VHRGAQHPLDSRVAERKADAANDCRLDVLICARLVPSVALDLTAASEQSGVGLHAFAPVSACVRLAG